MRRALRHSLLLLLFGLWISPLGAFARAQEAPSDNDLSPEKSSPLSNEDVLNMLEAGLSAEIVVAKIRSTATRFDTSPGALKELKAAGVPGSVILSMVEAPAGESSEAARGGVVSAEAKAERGKLETMCPQCKGILLYQVDGGTGTLNKWWLTKHQRKFLETNVKTVKAGKLKPRFLFVQHEENADYVILWTQAKGYRPYVYYVPLSCLS